MEISFHTKSFFQNQNKKNGLDYRKQNQDQIYCKNGRLVEHYVPHIKPFQINRMWNFEINIIFAYIYICICFWIQKCFPIKNDFFVFILYQIEPYLKTLVILKLNLQIMFFYFIIYTNLVWVKEVSFIR